MQDKHNSQIVDPPLLLRTGTNPIKQMQKLNNTEIRGNSGHKYNQYKHRFCHRIYSNHNGIILHTQKVPNLYYQWKRVPGLVQRGGDGGPHTTRVSLNASSGPIYTLSCMPYSYIGAFFVKYNSLRVTDANVQHKSQASI